MAEQKFAARFAIMFSHERSGSHYFADMLTQTGAVRSFDEVCNFNALNPDISRASFFRFRYEAQVLDPDVLLRPSSEVMGRLLTGYFKHLSDLAKPGKKLMVDLKYGHVHNFEIGWWPTERRPFLIGWLEQQGIPILHLSRRDSLATTVSAQIAERRRVWHTTQAPTDEIALVQLDPQETVRQALMLEREKQNFRHWLSGNKCFALDYEQICGGEEDRHLVMAKVCEFLSITPPEKFESKYLKTTPPLPSVLQNYEDVMERARLSGLGQVDRSDRP